MSPDDPRHGTYAGAQAHRADKSDVCLPCRTALRRFSKATSLRLHQGVRNRIPLGKRAHAVLVNMSCTQVGAMTGLERNHLYRLQKRGPNAQVMRATRDAILRVQAPTNVGLQRRLRALAMLGYPFEAIASEAGCNTAHLARAARVATPVLMRPPMVAAIVDVYDRLHDTVPPNTRPTVRRRTMAARLGWLPPQVWDDIDDPNEDPLAQSRDDYVDEVVVERLMAGVRMPSTRAEKIEAMSRWLAAGHSQRSLCVMHGWAENRYVVRQDGAA